MTPWTIAHQAPLSMGFFGQEYWRGSPCPPPGDLPDPGTSLVTQMVKNLPAMWQTQVPSLSQEDSCLGKPMERGPWQATMHGVAE